MSDLQVGWVESNEENSDVQGFFNFAPAYDYMMKDPPAGATVVEIGVYHGKSLLYLSKLARRLKRDIRVVGVDWGTGDGGYGPTVDICIHNLRTRGVETPLICCNSWDGAQFFPDSSIYMAFIDASHVYAAVRRDIEAWWPKIQPGGFLSGHDYECGVTEDGAPYDFKDYPGVKQAVDEKFGPGHGSQPMFTCWMVQK